MNQIRSLSVLLTHTFRMFGSKFSVIALPLVIYGGTMGLVAILLLGSVVDQMTDLLMQVSIYGTGFSADSMDLLMQVGGVLTPLIPYILVAMALQIFVYPLLTGFIHTVQFSEIEGIGKDRRAAFQIVKKNYTRLLFTSVAMWLLSLGLMVGLVLIMVVFASFAPSLASIVMLGMAFGVVLLSIAMNYALPMTMAKRIQGFEAVKHSIAIMFKGGFGRNFGHALLISLMISFATQTISSLFGGFMYMGSEITTVIMNFVSTIVLQLISGFLIVGSGFMYINAQVDYDYRTRQEQN